MRNAIGEVLGLIFAVVLWLMIPGSLITSLWHTAQEGQGLKFLASLIFPPFGVLNGLWIIAVSLLG